MISWAQNAEDVVLARAFPKTRGFYVDVGAADPVVASVTKHFYDLGWSGINIDPRPDAFHQLSDVRERDLNLQIAVSNRPGTAIFQINEQDRDQSYLGAVSTATTAIEVITKTLDQVLTEAEAPAIDFVKIDVEGAEELVLQGFSLSRWRPRVVVIEAIAPWSHHRVDTQWRHLLEAAGYREASFDGINLFFAHESEDPEFFELLAPASALDDYTPRSQKLLQDRLSDVEKAYQAVEDLTRERERALTEAAAYVRTLEQALARTSVVEAELDGPGPRRYRRVAILGSKNTLARATAEALATALDAPIIEPQHPSELRRPDLPDRAVLLFDLPATPATMQSLVDRRIVPVQLEMTPDLVRALHDDSHSAAPLAEWITGDQAAALRRDVMAWRTWPRTVRLDEAIELLDLVAPFQPTAGSDRAAGPDEQLAVEFFDADDA